MNKKILLCLLVLGLVASEEIYVSDLRVDFWSKDKTSGLNF